MSMLKYYFDCQAKIYITLKDVNDSIYENMILNLKTAILKKKK